MTLWKALSVRRWLLLGLVLCGQSAHGQTEPANNSSPESLDSANLEDSPIELKTNWEDSEAEQQAAKSAARGELNEDLKSLLDKHRFCSEADYRIPIDERALCALSEQAKARCPGIESACKNPFQQAPDSWNLSLDWLSSAKSAIALRIVV